MRNVALLIPFAALAVLSCKASVKADINASTKENEEPEPIEAAVEPLPPPVLHTEYFGVARGLTLTPVQRPATCRCVTAVVGSARDPNFDWHGEVPDVGVDAMVVAIGTEGIQCDQPGRGPSIAAIDRVNNDVVIVLEEFKESRPIALGAIIPNPGPEGGIYLRSRGNAVYGRPEGTGYGYRQNLCKIGQGTSTGIVGDTGSGL